VQRARLLLATSGRPRGRRCCELLHAAGAALRVPMMPPSDTSPLQSLPAPDDCTPSAARQRTREGSQRTWLWLLVALFVALLPLSPAFERPGLSMDEGALLVYPELILKGALPYRDFETFYGPANLWTLAAIYKIFGVSFEVERAVGLLYRALALMAVFLITRRAGTALAVVSLFTASLLLFLARLPAFAWFAGVACVLWSLIALGKALAENSRSRCVAAGLLAALALLYRLDLAPAVILSALPLWLLLRWRDRWLHAASMAAGLLPLLVLLASIGWRPLFENLFLYPVIICNPGRRLPLSQANDEVVFLFLLHVAAALSSVVAGWLLVKEERGATWPRLFLGTALFALAVTHQSLQRTDLVHVVFAAFLSMGLLPVALCLLRRRGPVRGAPASHAAVAGAVVVALLAAGSWNVFRLYFGQVARNFSTEPTARGEVRVRDRAFRPNVPPEQLQKVLHFVAENSKSGERLFVGPGDLRRAFANDLFIYHLLPWLTPSTYFLEMNPFSANRPNSRLASDVASADWLILNSAWDHPREDNLSTQNGPDAPNAVVREQFELRGQIGPYRVYYRKQIATK
jgi:hypothetical protein